LNELNKEINYKLQNKILSEYYLFFYNTEYNHKFFLIDYEKNNEKKVVKRIKELIKYINENDPRLITYQIDKYENFKVK